MIQRIEINNSGIKIFDETITLFSSYAQIFFSNNWVAGFLFLASTCIVPSQAIAGLLGLILTNYAAIIFGFSKDHVAQGYYAYNGLLTGLALGMTYRINISFFVMIVIASILGAVIAASIRTIFERYLFIPVLCIPFILTSWTVISGGQIFSGLVYTLKPFEVTFLDGFFPYQIEIFFRTLGATFFQKNVPAGLLVAVGLMITSRISFILAVLGFTSGYIVYNLLGADPVYLHSHLVGFNFILTAISVGGIWVVSDIDSLLLAFVSGAVCAVVTAAISFILLPLGLPALAFPFVVTTSIILYALKHRISPNYCSTIAIPDTSPEKNLKRHKNTRARFVTGEVPSFNLPVAGSWTITQGFNGEHTHKNLWAHAWDFEIIDKNGNAFSSESNAPNDYYAFNKPVFSPADGKVVTVINHIQDNQIGKINENSNWGNTVVIWHYGIFYTSLSHFKSESIIVKEGEIVHRGQLIGKVGNSGRSPVPHLHFQVQLSPEIGAPTVPSQLIHYISKNKDGDCYYTHGCPAENEIIQPMETENQIYSIASFPLEQTWNFSVKHSGRQTLEEWKTEIDFAGNRYLVCEEKNAKLKFFINSKVLLLIDYKGPKDTGLYWFFMTVPRLPMTTQNIYWVDELPGDLLISKMRSVLFDLMEPVYTSSQLTTISKLEETGSKSFAVKTSLLQSGLLAGNKNGQFSATANFQKYFGLKSIIIEQNNVEIFSISLQK